MIGVAAIAAVLGLAGVLFLMNDNGPPDNKGGSASVATNYELRYYKNGEMVRDLEVPAGAYIVVEDDIDANGASERFLGWNTKPDLSGTIFQSGAKLKVEGNLSFYAMFINSNMYAIILPEKQDGYTITADRMMVAKGGISILTYSLLPSHVDYDLVIAVNGNPMKLDALKEIHLFDIQEDKIVTVTGVHDRRMHSITLPEPQRGYILTSSAESVHHGEPYSMQYTLLPGWGETSDFGIHINGVDVKRPIDGAVLVEDVRDNHVITVTGVELVQYSIAAGKNITAFVNGAPVSRATVEDLILIEPAEGYIIPSTFNGQITGGFKAEGKGYRITGNTAFPSVSKVTAGDNVTMNGSSAKTVFVCPGDRITISASTGYSMPGNYMDTIRGLDGAAYSAQGFTFSKDAALPSIYKVVFNSHNSVYETFFVIGGAAIPLPQNAPKRIAYYFAGWDIASSSVRSDLSIRSIWDPMTHDVFFGPNLIVDVGNKCFVFEEGNAENAPRIIQVRSDEKVRIHTPFDLPLPDGYGPESGVAVYGDGYYDIIENCSFPGVTYVRYFETEVGDGPVDPLIIGCGYNIMPEPTISKEGYIFAGWVYNGKPISGHIKIENEKYILFPTWEQKDG
ncbi:MAG: InlB B-repeat-containing protein [Methanomassiliicoccaceae archaeon]|nr:InlB B-repeat-containing protein [Methanomassiliicoccaceae archaeon]